MFLLNIFTPYLLFLAQNHPFIHPNSVNRYVQSRPRIRSPPGRKCRTNNFFRRGNQLAVQQPPTPESTSLSVLTPVAHHEDDLERCESNPFDAFLSHPFYCSSQTPQLICLTARLRRCPPTRNSWISSSAVPSASFLPRFVLVSRSVVSEVLYFLSDLYPPFHLPPRTTHKKKRSGRSGYR